MKTIVRHEKCVFLPAPVRAIIFALENLKDSYTSMARERAVSRRAPVGNSVEAEVYPFYPSHTPNRRR